MRAQQAQGSVPTVLLVGGGTGGHVFPMIAVADALRELLPTVRCVFVGTERGIETRVVPRAGYELRLVKSAPIRGGGVVGAWRGVTAATTSLPAGMRLLKELQPAVVFSLGGYAAGPVSLAARLAGTPLALMEPNSVIGLANRLIAPFVARAYTAFADAEKNFSARALMRSGVAIRAGFEPVPFSPRWDALRVLVLGGSQGARSLNESVPRALSQVERPLSIVHQAGDGKDVEVRALYATLELAADVQSFIDDMPRALANADLIIGRAGAGAVSEICAVGRPSILVPYPFAAGDHQRVNAESLERAGAAVCIRDKEATPALIAETMTDLLAEPERLGAMAAAAQAWGKPYAARTVAQDLLALGGLREPASLGAGPRGVMIASTEEVH